nr:MAG TPA: hypothetical protein [Caudoviricetes sp.]
MFVELRVSTNEERQHCSSHSYINLICRKKHISYLKSSSLL